MSKIDIWYAGKQDDYSAYLIKKIRNSECLQFSKAFYKMKELKQELQNGNPDILILDVEKKNKKLLSRITEVYKINNNLKIILLLEAEDEDLLTQAICRGAFDYIIKDEKLINFESKITEVHTSKSPLHSLLNNNVKKKLENISLNQVAYDLSPRETEILNLMIRGLTKRRMADTLNLSFHTIDSHLRKIYQKLGVNSKTQAVSKALKEQLFTL